MPDTAKDLAKKDIFNALMHGQSRHRIAGVFSLNDSIKAHQAFEKGNQFGCVLLDYE